MLLVKPVLAVALLLSAPFGQTDEPPQGAIVVNIKDVASTRRPADCRALFRP